jgi:hypothetical protein
MILKYSDSKGVPYIEFENGSSLSFPLFMEDSEKGWKYVTFSGTSTESILISGKGAKRKRYVDILEHIGFTADLSLPTSDIDKRVRGKQGPLSPTILSFLRKTFGKLAPDGYLSRESLAVLERELIKVQPNKEDYMNDDPTTVEEEEDDE